MLRSRCLPPSPLSAQFSSFPRPMSLRDPSSERRDASRALWCSFQHSAAPGVYLPAPSCWHPLCPEILYRDTRLLLVNAPSTKVGVYQTKRPKRELRTCFTSRRNERGRGINEETAMLSPWYWRFKVDRIRSRFASSVDMGPCQPARFWIKNFVYCLKDVALIVLRGHGREGKRRRGELPLVAAALPKIDSGWLCSYGRLA